MRHSIFLLLIYSVSTFMCKGQTALVKAAANKASLSAGESTTLTIRIAVKKGYHIQASQVEDEALIPTTLVVNMEEGLTITGQEFPPVKQFQLEGTNTFLNVYDGEFTITLFVHADSNLQARNYLLNATLHYQACDARSCLFPRSFAFSIPLTVTKKKQSNSQQ
jgi:DsbC/DsbD-like thiol-disulfide interchange protein